jgi:hypothetical protein
MDEDRELEEEYSAPSADDSAAPAAIRRKMFSMKVGECAEGSAESKASLMKDSDALLRLAEEIMHGESEYLGILPTKQHSKSLVPGKCARHLSQ